METKKKKKLDYIKKKRKKKLPLDQKREKLIILFLNLKFGLLCGFQLTQLIKVKVLAK